MNNISIGKRLAMGFGLVLLLTVLLGTYAWRTMGTMDQHSTAMEITYVPLVNMAAEMEGALSTSLMSMKDYFASGNESYFKAGMDSLLKTREMRNKAHAMLQGHPELVAMRDALNELDAVGITYLKVVSSSAQALRDLHTARATMAKQEDIVSSIALEFQVKQQDRLSALILADAPREEIELANRSLRFIAEIDTGIAAMRFIELRAQTINSFEAISGVTQQLDVVKRKIKEFEPLIVLPEFRERFVRLQQGMVDFAASEEHFAKIWKQLIDMSDERVQLGTALINSVQEVTRRSIDITTETAQVLSAETANGAQNALMVTALAVILALCVSVLLTRTITGPLGVCVQFAEAVAKGDLKRTLNLHQQDEIGRLGDSLTTMVHTLNGKIAEADDKTQQASLKEHEALQAMQQAQQARAEAESARREGMLSAALQLEKVVEIIGAASSQLATQIAHSEHGAGNAAARLTETATAMEEMNSTVLEVAKNAGAASDVYPPEGRKRRQGGTSGC